MFKIYWGKESPKTTDKDVKAKYKSDLLQAQMTYIEETSFPSQGKRKVSGIRGEQERLLTVLFYSLHKKEEEQERLLTVPMTRTTRTVNEACDDGHNDVL